MSGAPVSTMNARVAVAPRLPSQAAKTEKTCGPSPRSGVENGLVQTAKPAVSRLQEKSTFEPGLFVKEKTGVVSFVIPLGPLVIFVLSGPLQIYFAVAEAEARTIVTTSYSPFSPVTKRVVRPRRSRVSIRTSNRERPSGPAAVPRPRAARGPSAESK